ncbi:hypothetical protein BOSE62_80017 [Bosea sp. 62]|nr:hypothetical protein BOSE21B_80146 [Bosea sp. 21B]CAD5299796.1 hypothetical protein BOSE7B_60667 [Bosea sp. 7B]VVT57025.1 hypothetical protein BOS5A_180016 [Bosea sp. EC-HK365B]VXB47231.1 hypothetical protein BOSE127_120127 [Bosea sp. 127]VXC95019.1 hypothetical protein BOSE62_80017 [Bosea sp. 62]
MSPTIRMPVATIPIMSADPVPDSRRCRGLGHADWLTLSFCFATLRAGELTCLTFCRGMFQLFQRDASVATTSSHAPLGGLLWHHVMSSAHPCAAHDVSTTGWSVMRP